MTTPADAAEVITLVVAYHHRTAPRVDDEQVFRATAKAWSDLFSDHNLSLPDLLAAVKKRASFCADAPEPAEIIQYAREIRRARDAETGPTPEYEALCESKAEDADELAAIRRNRGEITENKPRIDELVAHIAERKAI